MAREKIISNFKPDFKRIKTYERKYINLPYDIVNNKNFLQFKKLSVYKIYLILGIISFEKAETSGWFPITIQELMEKSLLSENSVRNAIHILEKNKFIDVGIAYRKNSNTHFSNCYRINGFLELST